MLQEPGDAIYELPHLPYEIWIMILLRMPRSHMKLASTDVCVACCLLVGGSVVGWSGHPPTQTCKLALHKDRSFAPARDATPSTARVIRFDGQARTIPAR